MNDTIRKDEWYQQPAMWVVMGVLGFTFIASFILVLIASQNQPDLVVEDYSRIAEITAAQDMQAKRARELGMNAVLVCAMRL